MSDSESIHQPEGLIRLSPQLDFPASDLRNDNVDYLKYIFDTEPSVDMHGKLLEDHQRSLFSIAVQALDIAGMNPDNSYKEYAAFTNGFAAFELISMTVRLRQYNNHLANQRAQILLMSGSLTEIELAEHFHTWPGDKPNTYELILQTGEDRHKALNEIRARLMGAQIAYELQKPLSSGL